jgi:hypothetical protein
MANEISGSFQLSVQNGSLVNTRSHSFNADQATARMSGAVQNIPTTAAGTLLAFNASLTTQGVAYFVNLDATNYVEIGIQQGGTFYPLARINGGATGKKEGYAFRLAQGVSVYARANTAAVDLEFGVLHN